MGLYLTFNLKVLPFFLGSKGARTTKQASQASFLLQFRAWEKESSTVFSPFSLDRRTILSEREDIGKREREKLSFFSRLLL